MAKIKIETPKGDIIVRLYDDTPKHRDNMLKLVEEGFYNGTLFHRVIKDFMVQGGDPDSKNAPKGKQLGAGGPDYTIEAEFTPAHFHKRGALAAARLGDEVNPNKESSGRACTSATSTSPFFASSSALPVPDRKSVV